MASRLTHIRATWTIVAERSNYKGVQLIARSPKTRNYHFMEFAFNGNELSTMSEGYTRLSGLLKSMASAAALRESFGGRKSKNLAHEYFKLKK